MSKTVYNKLIRDRIPEIIATAGKEYETAVMGEDEYIQALRTKLVEEAQEAQQASSEDLVVELADLQEVINALMDVYCISSESLDAVRASRYRERGGFTQRLKLIWSG